MNKKRFNIWLLLAMFALGMPMMTSCSDEPDGSNFRTFDDEMMSTYLQSRPQYSDFSQIVTRSGLMDMLSTYGSYTCFAPNNDAVQMYLSNRGLTSIDQLTDAECDTIARTHLMQTLFTTMNTPITDKSTRVALPQPNMNDRYLEVELVRDEQDRQVVCLNGMARILFEEKDDSVVNGIVQPIDHVLESSNRLLPDVIKQNPALTIYYEALQLTGLRDSLYRYKDENYKQVLDKNDNVVWVDYTTGSNILESARSPKEKLYGFTAFLVPDSILQEKYGITNVEGLYNKACEIYDPIYGGESEDYHKLENATDRRNPLNRFISYHLLNRNVHGYNLLTVINDYGIRTDRINPMEWYETMFPYTMLKVEKLKLDKYLAGGAKNDIFLNRRVDARVGDVLGVRVMPTNPGGLSGNAMNGYYFCIEDILKYDEVMTGTVMNCRMRMDMSTIFPEVMTNNMRMNYKSDAALTNNDPAHDHTEKYGTNYFFPNGYLKGVTVGNNGYFIYRRPRLGFYSYCGDEFICQDNFDVTFRIPPVPTEGDYQVRLGYAAMSIRGIAQVYFDGKPQGIPLDMRKELTDNNERQGVLGKAYWDKYSDYDKLTDEEKSEELKELKNQGYYRGCQGGHTSWNLDDIKNNQGSLMSNMSATLRIVLCTVHMKPFEDHYLRFRCVSEGLGNNEIMLDYLEIVPKSVYGVTDEGVMEDPL